jgi:hypothetical protein
LPLECIQEAQSSAELQTWLYNPLELCIPSKSSQPIKAGLHRQHTIYVHEFRKIRNKINCMVIAQLTFQDEVEFASSICITNS